MPRARQCMRLNPWKLQVNPLAAECCSLYFRRRFCYQVFVQDCSVSHALPDIFIRERPTRCFLHGMPYRSREIRMAANFDHAALEICASNPASHCRWRRSKFSGIRTMVVALHSVGPALLVINRPQQGFGWKRFKAALATEWFSRQHTGAS